MFFWGNDGGGSRNLPPNNCGIWVTRGSVASCANTGAVNRISDAAFDARWPGGAILFDEYAIGTSNPTYTPLQYGAVGAFQPNVSFDSWFLNQAFAPPPFAEGVIANPLALDLGGGPGTFIQNDGARPPGETTALFGSPGFSGPRAMLFTEADFTTPKPVVGVSFNLGFCNAIGAIRVRAYDATGALLGTWLNTTAGGYEFVNLNRDSNVPIIAGVIIDGNDVAGFSIRNVRFSNECA